MVDGIKEVAGVSALKYNGKGKKPGSVSREGLGLEEGNFQEQAPLLCGLWCLWHHTTCQVTTTHHHVTSAPYATMRPVTTATI